MDCSWGITYLENLLQKYEIHIGRPAGIDQKSYFHFLLMVTTAEVVRGVIPASEICF